jgi:hypothetical protein
MKKEYHSTNNVEHEFWFSPNDIKCCASESKINLGSELANSP